MSWNHTKLGSWFWHNYWYRIDWWRGDREFKKWIEYARKHTMHITITPKYLDEMEEMISKRPKFPNPFRNYYRRLKKGKKHAIKSIC